MSTILIVLLVIFLLGGGAGDIPVGAGSARHCTVRDQPVDHRADPKRFTMRNRGGERRLGPEHASFSAAGHTYWAAVGRGLGPRCNVTAGLAPSAADLQAKTRHVPSPPDVGWESLGG